MTPIESIVMPTERKRDRLARKPAKGHRSGCDCKWCKPEYLQKAPGDILTRSDPTISVRVRPEEREAFSALCERLGESPPRVIRAEILRLIEEDRESQALDRLTNDEANTKGVKAMRVIKFKTESGEYLVAREDGNGNLLYRNLENGEGLDGWLGSPLSSGLREFSENPLKIAQRVNQYLDRYEGSVAESVLSAEEILSGIDLEISDEGIGDVPFDHYLKAVREVMDTAYPSWVEIDIKPVTRVFGHSTKISFWGLEDDAAEDSERREVRRLLEKAWELACDTCEVA